ncbi:MAG: hypothetical protein ACLR1P_09980 [Oscillospiraceae bacterium]
MRRGRDDAGAAAAGACGRILGYVRQAGGGLRQLRHDPAEDAQTASKSCWPKEKFEEMGNSYYAHCERKARERALQAQAEQQT